MKECAIKGIFPNGSALCLCPNIIIGGKLCGLESWQDLPTPKEGS